MATAKRELTDTRVQGRPDNRDRLAGVETTAERAVVSDDGDLRASVREMVRRAREEQGLPPKITDPAVISRIVALLQPDVDE